MSAYIFLIEPGDSKSSLKLNPMTFADLGVQERQDLEEWIKRNPAILGEKLLLISSEYDQFDKSDKRLDLLALDRKGKLTIIELKRDAARSHADLQAIRYAAFCSTMLLKDVIDLFAKFATKNDKDEAERRIREFVECRDFSDIGNKPRIILAAGSFDVEITSCVLWLRSFGVDISCVEITPYRMSQDQIVLVPRVIIPLPEAKDYIVKVERKEAEQKERKRITEEDLLQMADSRSVRSLLNICREVGGFWNESSSNAYGGSFIYSLIPMEPWKTLLGINVSGDRKHTPAGQLDIWIPIEKVGNATNQDQSTIRSALNQDLLPVVSEEKVDLVIRLSSVDQANALVNTLRSFIQ